MSNLYYFNPDNEMAIANGRVNYTPPSNIKKMIDDLAYLPAYLCEDGDYILMENDPDVEFWEEQRKIFNIKCHPVSFIEAENIKIDELRPWGWSPRVHYLFHKLGIEASWEFRQGVMANWSDGRQKYYSREMGKICLEELQQVFVVPSEIIPQKIFSVDEVKPLLHKQNIVVKTPWSSSGKGILMLHAGELKKKDEEWLHGMLGRQGYLMVEPKLNKVCDFAMEFYIDRSFRVHFAGLSYFFTGERGEYRGNYVGNSDRLVRKLTFYMDREFLERLKTAWIGVLEKVYCGIYTGYLGIDMMVFRDVHGMFQVQPCVEVNLRYNMGILSCKLGENFVHDRSEGMFQVHFFPQSEMGIRYCDQMRKNAPLIMEDKKIRDGYIALTPVKKDSLFVADLLVKSL